MNNTSELSTYIDATIRKLQGSYVYGDKRGSSAALASLRRAVNAAPGADPDVWAYTLEGLPRKYVGSTDAPTAGEHAAHAAMTLYAVHQQSRTTPMHRIGPSMGRAVRRLGGARSVAGKPDASSAVKRRFDALMTAVTFAELTYHARGLVQQLRAAEIGLDYGKFAEDLRLLQNPAGADSVRLRWGRDYATLPAEHASQENTTTAPEGAAS